MFLVFGGVCFIFFIIMLFIKSPKNHDKTDLKMAIVISIIAFALMFILLSLGG